MLAGKQFAESVRFFVVGFFAFFFFPPPLTRGSLAGGAGLRVPAARARFSPDPWKLWGLLVGL